jgi:hypothetical protein
MSIPSLSDGNLAGYTAAGFTREQATLLDTLVNLLMKLSAAHGNAVLEEVVALRTVLMAKEYSRRRSLRLNGRGNRRGHRPPCSWKPWPTRISSRPRRSSRTISDVGRRTPTPTTGHLPRKAPRAVSGRRRSAAPAWCRRSRLVVSTQIG